MTDPLTGIANRKYFDIHLRKSVPHSMENGRALSLMMVDIDHFKNINETYRHQTGDDTMGPHTLACWADIIHQLRTTGRFVHQIANAMVFRPKVL